MLVMTESPMVDLTQDPRNIIRRSRELIDEALAENLKLKARVRDLESCLARMVQGEQDARQKAKELLRCAD
jgi:hypothetical protein